MAISSLSQDLPTTKYLRGTTRARLLVSGGSYHGSNGFLQTLFGHPDYILLAFAPKTGTSWLLVLLFSIASCLITKEEELKLNLSTHPHKLIPQAYLVSHGLIRKEDAHKLILSTMAS
ncbi:hypothetical protein AMTR_s00015p00230950 [Amborella trichopoda]|uniref:Sulfotransferase n=1 Tax=Amborella trichopoda TaxID=13333 RepID=W1PLJ2_AMBTC|nr:hypothetical protein AMTR_s00015p00230950 [Amborella trichopoda]